MQPLLPPPLRTPITPHIASLDGRTMPRLLNLRALCSSCEGAEASHWCGGSSSALCGSCLRGRPVSPSSPVPVPIVSRSVVAALCSRCSVAPAAVFAVDKGTPLCGICAAKERKRDKGQSQLVPLRDSAVAKGLVFDKMDFTSLFQGNAEGNAKAEASPEQQGAGEIDWSYYKTQVPESFLQNHVPKKKKKKRDKSESAAQSASGKEKTRTK